MKASLALAATLIFTSTAHAVIDMKTANFAETWVDLIAPGSGPDLRVQRTYNSRTIYSGMFGFGWCSELETRLEITPEGNMKVIECGAGAEIIYTPKKFDGKKIDVTVGAIMAEVKKRNSGMSEKSLTDLERDLKDDDFFREEFARRINLKGTVNKDTTYFANGRENETLTRQSDNFKRTLADGTYQIYDPNGRLLSTFDRNGNSVKYVYEKDRLTGVFDNNGRRLTMIYPPNSKKVKRITGPNNMSVDYVVKGEDLTEVTNAWKKKYKYTYDDVHNITKVHQPDGTAKSISYNKDKDWVTGFINEKGCVESYEYKMNPDDPKNHYWSTVVKTCQNKVTNRSSYEFFHRQRLDNAARFLYRVKSDVNGQITDIVYHEVFGKPVTIIRGNFKTEYVYFDSGMVKQKKESGRLTSFEYNTTCNKPAKVDVDYFDPAQAKDKSKVTRRVHTTFSYETKKCNLVYAENSEGQTVKLQYDTRGRISVIEDQSKKLVKIKYEERLGKPEVVTRPGLGTIKVNYKNDGEISSVESKEGPRVAVQVASIFNNLLDIIAPASAETNL
jgi:YD repeat-containing protein